MVNPAGHHLTRYAPADDLLEIVEGFYVFESDLSDRAQLFFNDGYPLITFMHANTERITISSGERTFELGKAWVCGGMLKNTYCESSIPFHRSFVIRFQPWAFFKLFNLDDSFFKQSQVFNLDKLGRSDYSGLIATFYSLPDRENKMQAITGFLREKISSFSYPAVLTDILNQIDRTEVVSIKRLLEDTAAKLNYKWLERNFKKHLGISPKDYVSIRRFLNTYQDLGSPGAKDLLGIALRNGYYDANHLIKDFRKFSGMPPKTYFQRAE